MKVLGGHILKRALALTGYDTFPLLQFQNLAEPNSAGFRVPMYQQVACIKAQVQAVSRSQVAYMGLDFEKNYIMVYTEYQIQDVQRDGAADRMIYGGMTYEFLNSSFWKKPQGFNGAMAVQINE